MDGNRSKLTDVNPYLVCVLCHGYFVDATTIAECLHSFCRSCIIRHLEKKSICPICETQVHTKLPLSLRLDKTLQDIVYKLVPGLFRNEMQRRRDFYQNHPYRDEHLDPEFRGVGLDRLIYSPDDLISLSLEFYNEELEKEVWSNNNNSPKQKQEKEATPSGTKRFLQCPAAFKMAHLKKFIRQKYGLPPNCNVEILYRRESLPDSYSLMDIAYIYTWKRNGPMRFYYRMPDFKQKLIMQPLEVNEVKEVQEVVEAKEEKKEEKTEIEKEEAKEKKEIVDPISKVEKKEEIKKEEVPNGVRQMSKQDELSVSVLLSLGNVVEERKEEKDHEFLLPKPFSYPKAPNTPRPNTEYNKKILNGKLNPKFSVNKIASALAKNNLKKLPWKKEEKDPFAFNDSKISPVQYKPLQKEQKNELTVPPLKISLTKGNPRVDPSSLPPPKAPSPIPALYPAKKPKTPPLPKSPSPPKTPLLMPKIKSPPLVKSPPKTPLPSMPMITSPPLVSPPKTPLPSMPKIAALWPAMAKKKPERPEVTVKTTNGSLTITTQPVEPMMHKLPCIPRPPIRKNLKPVPPGGVISKTGPTLDQRIQQLYKSKSPVQVPTESRLASWLNNRFQPKIEKKSPEKETDVAKVSKEMNILKRKLDELRKAQNACEITQENPSPKTRDVTPDVSIEFLRAADMKSKEKTKRPVPALKAIQDVEKRKNTEDDKSVKKAKIDDSALDLTSRMRLPEPSLHWMLNRPLLANQFVPRST